MVFIWYLLRFCLMTVALVVLVLGLYITLANAGLIRIPTYERSRIEASEEALREGRKDVAGLLPDTCLYGIYDPKGEYLEGNFPERLQEEAWEITADDGYTGRFYNTFYMRLEREDGKILVIRYQYIAKFENPLVRRLFPNAEFLFLGVLLVLFPLQAALTARSFGRYLKKRLQVLTEIAGKVGREDLNFQQEHSDIREVDEVLTSLFVMKQALQKSLKEQWEARQQKQEQVAALAHDIKTPLTIIRGNAELVQETEDLEEIREWDREILDGARQLEGYLAVLQETLRERDEGQDKEEGEETFDGCGFVRELEEKARALGRAGQVEVSCSLPEKDVTIRGRSGIREELMRAAQNVISNGVDYVLREPACGSPRKPSGAGGRNSGRSRSRTAARDLPERCCCMGPNSFTRETKAAPARIITGWDCILPGRSWRKPVDICVWKMLRRPVDRCGWGCRWKRDDGAKRVPPVHSVLRSAAVGAKRVPLAHSARGTAEVIWRDSTLRKKYLTLPPRQRVSS